MALPIPTVRVPPITMGEARDARSRDDARAELGLRSEGRAILLAAGGGGDDDAVRRAISLAETITRAAPDVTPVLALGPLAGSAAARTEARRSAPQSPIRIVAAAPLQPLLAAFDGAFSPAGYNTAHELAKAGVPAALFAQPRPFDDQAARVDRFAKASLAHALRRFDDEAIAAALTWMEAQPRNKSAIEAGGADRAADALLDLVTKAASR